MKRINVGMLLEGAAFILLGIMLFLMAATGAFMYYVTPRTVPYLYFAAVVLVLLGIHAFGKLFARNHVHHYSYLMVLLVPVLLIGWSVDNAGILKRLSQNTSAQESARVEDGENAYVMKQATYAGTVLHGYDAANKTLTIPQEETYLWLEEIYNDPEPFLGFTVTTMGQVMKDPQYFADGCFSPVRKLMTCCAADLYPIGFICQYGDTASLTDDAWVSVTGTLELMNFEEYSELRIVAESVAPSEPSREPYVYTYAY